MSTPKRINAIYPAASPDEKEKRLLQPTAWQLVTFFDESD